MPCGPQVQCMSGLGCWDHKDLMDAEGWVGNGWYLGGNMDTVKKKKKPCVRGRTMTGQVN